MSKENKRWNWEVITAMFGGYFIGVSGNFSGWGEFICLFIGMILLTITILYER